jgi:riboflavin synthase alpha subunit
MAHLISWILVVQIDIIYMSLTGGGINVDENFEVAVISHNLERNKMASSHSNQTVTFNPDLMF